MIIIMPSTLTAHSSFAQTERPKLQPLFTDFTSIERSMLSDHVSSDTDFEDDGSSIDDYDDYWPAYPDRRISQSTISTVDEAQTPPAAYKAQFDLPDVRSPSVQGPSGPHLFRASVRSQQDLDDSFALQLSPLFSKAMTLSPASFNRPEASLNAAVAHATGDHISTWSARQVASWIVGLGFEETLARKFQSQEIDGSVLLNLHFADLKALDIPSLGKRQKIWTKLEALRKNPASSDMPSETSVKQRPGARASTYGERIRQVKRVHDEIASPVSSTATTKRRGRMNRANFEDAVTPAESISIVAIEQLIPKQHICTKGENCVRWQRQQRLIEQLNQEHGCNISPSDEDQIFISGFPGNAHNAERILENVVVQTPTPTEAPLRGVPPVVRLPVRTSDLELQEHSLRSVKELSPQENVRRFLSLQEQQQQQQEQRPQTPPAAYEDLPHFEMFPTPPLPPPVLQSRASQTDLRRPEPSPFSTPILVRSASAQPRLTASPLHKRQSAWSLQHGSTPPTSSSSWPTSTVPSATTDPIPRHASASAPPNITQQEQHQHQPRILHSASSSSYLRRKPSLALPTVHEVPSHISVSPVTPALPKPADLYGPGTTHAGWAKQLRRTRTSAPRSATLLPFLLPRRAKQGGEWTDAHLRLNGTLLSVFDSAVTANALPPHQAIDVKDYTIACNRRGIDTHGSPDSLSSSEVASPGPGARFAAALKALRGGGSTTKSAVVDQAPGAPYTFSLVPCAVVGPAGAGARDSMGAGRDSKTKMKTTTKKQQQQQQQHMFAVASVEDRVDWMREVMLAKAIGQKREGFEVVVDGVRM